MCFLTLSKKSVFCYQLIILCTLAILYKVCCEFQNSKQNEFLLFPFIFLYLILIFTVFETEYSRVYQGKDQRTFNVSGKMSKCDTPLFDGPEDWQNELQRCGCSSKWRVTDVNTSFQLSMR